MQNDSAQPVSTLLIQNAFSQRSVTLGGGGEQYYIPRNNALQASAKEKWGGGENRVLPFQAGLELLTLLPPLPECQNYRHVLCPVFYLLLRTEPRFKQNLILPAGAAA